MPKGKPKQPADDGADVSKDDLADFLSELDGATPEVEAPSPDPVEMKPPKATKKIKV